MGLSLTCSLHGMASAPSWSFKGPRFDCQYVADLIRTLVWARYGGQQVAEAIQSSSRVSFSYKAR